MKVLRLLLAVLAVLCVAIGLGIVGAAANTRMFIYHPSRIQHAVNYHGVSLEHIRTADGETLIAWYLPPPVIDGKRGPIFLFFDGNAGRPEVWEGRWRRIEHGGAGFLAVYYRGYSGSTGTPSERGLNLDARAGYDWLIAHDYAPRDIVIHGFSLGTGPAVQLASEKSARALILEAPYTGLDDVGRVWVGPFGALVADKFASRDVIARVHMPVLIVHGDHDRVIPFKQGERLFALANEPKQFVRMPGSDHATLVHDGIYDHIWPFIDAHP